MTYDEALREIGVAPGSSPEEIRRAYLRKTRTWNPAADPEGLRRLREAHDLLLTAPPPPPQPLPPPGTYPMAPPLRSAAPLYEPREPAGTWTSVEPEPASSGRRWLAIFGGGLVLFLALWLGLSRYKADNAPSTELQKLHPYLPLPVAGYDSAQQGMTEICVTLGKKKTEHQELCDLAEGILQATAQHKCTDAKALRKRLDAYSVVRDGSPGQSATQKLASFKEKLDEEIARCWKFWNP